MKRSIGLSICVLLSSVFVAHGQESAGPVPSSSRLFGMSARGLETCRGRIDDGDPTLQPALDRLRELADAALNAGPFSVMDKTLVPPSGDKHDYVSHGPYWWPDPAKENGLPYIRRDGVRNPEVRTDRFDRQALGDMADSVVTLALGYHLMSNEAYAEHAARLLRVWFLDPGTKMNPHLEYAQGIPGRTDGRGIGIIDTTRLVLVPDAVSLIAPSKAWNVRDQEGMVAWFDAYLEWLLTSEHGKDEDKARNNHGTWYDVQVARFAVFVGRKDVAMRVLEASKSRRIESQIEPDGHQPRELARTKSLSYSTMNLTGMFALAELGDELGVDLWHYESEDGRSIRAALDFLAPYADPDTEWTYQQITFFSRRELLPLLRRGAIVYQDDRYEKWIEKLPRRDVIAHRIQLLYPK